MRSDRSTTHVLAAVAAAAALLAGGLLGTAPASARVDDVLTTGERLEPGDSLTSPSGRYRLQLVGDTLSLVERANPYSPSQAYLIEESGVGAVVLQGDGNLVVLGTDGRPRFGFGTQGTGTTAVRLQDDRNLVFLDGSGDVAADLGSYLSDLVVTGQALLPGDSVAGPGGTRLLMQADGNLVHYRGTRPLWSSRTQGNPGAAAVMQRDGNLVVYSSVDTGRRALFSTGTSGAPAGVSPVLEVEDTEVSVVLAQGDRIPVAAWGSNWSSDRVLPGDELDPGDRRSSRGGGCTLLMQTDGNLVEYCAGRAVFSTGVVAPPRPTDEGLAYGVARMQADGNFVVYRQTLSTAAPTPTFHTGTSAGGSSLVVQADGNVVVQTPGGRPAWSRLTGRL